MIKRESYHSLSDLKKAFEEDPLPQASESLVRPSDFAIDDLESLAGQKAQVRGGIAINCRDLSAERLKATQVLGHNRLEVTGAYYGSFPRLGYAITSHCVEMPRADYETDYKLDHNQTLKLKAAWSRIEPAMKEIGQLLRTNGVDNLYWIGSLSQGGAECECFEFMFPPGVDESTVEKLADPILDLVQKHSPDDDVYFYSWQSLDYIQQVRWAPDAIPVFKPVSPLFYIN